MSVIGIVCEFNPFHNGHKYLIDSVKKDGDIVVCTMSGNFVQRGEPALLDKHYRVKQALNCGADLVLELPVAYACSRAQTFSRGAVKLLDSLKIVDTLAFGSECGDTEKLIMTAKATEDENARERINSLIKTGVSFACARENAVRDIYGDELADILSSPNNILAVEYISALKLLKSKMNPLTVKRTGASHDSENSENEFASASLIREMLKNGESVQKYMPASAYNAFYEAINEKCAPSDYKKLDVAVLSFLRKTQAKELENAPDVSEGIENRIINSARTANTLEKVFENACTKRYPTARIRRIVLSAFLGIKKEDTALGMPYIRVLGFNEKGREALRSCKDKATLPIVMKASDISSLGFVAERSFSLECTATDIYNLTLPDIRPCGTEMTDKLVII